MSLLNQTKSVKNLTGLLVSDAERYLPFLQFLQIAIMEGNVELSTSERELIASYVSNLNECIFCRRAHRAMLTAMHVDENIIDAVGAYPAPEESDPWMRPILDFARKLALTPDQIERADIEALRDVGWSDQAIEEAMSVIALYSLVNRLVENIGTTERPAYFQNTGTPFVQGSHGQRIQTSNPKAA